MLCNENANGHDTETTSESPSGGSLPVCTAAELAELQRRLRRAKRKARWIEARFSVLLTYASMRLSKRPEDLLRRIDALIGLPGVREAATARLVSPRAPRSGSGGGHTGNGWEGRNVL
jgi:hypothetical protein